MNRLALTLTAAALAFPAPAAAGKPPLSIAKAKRAISVAVMTNSHPTAVRVKRCHHLSPRSVRCFLEEEVVEMPATPSGVGMIWINEGYATARLLHHHGHSYLRVTSG